MPISVTSARTAIYLQPYINHTATVTVQLRQQAGPGHGYPAIPCRDNTTITTAKTFKTTPLLSVEEGVEAMRKAQGAGYRRPAG